MPVQQHLQSLNLVHLLLSVLNKEIPRPHISKYFLQENMVILHILGDRWHLTALVYIFSIYLILYFQVTVDGPREPRTKSRFFPGMFGPLGLLPQVTSPSSPCHHHLVTITNITSARHHDNFPPSRGWTQCISTTSIWRDPGRRWWWWWWWMICSKWNL